MADRSFEQIEQNRHKISFKFGNLLVHILYHRPRFYYLDAPMKQEPFLFLVNHLGSNVPTRIECYFPLKFYMWGTYEMTMALLSFKALMLILTELIKRLS